MPVINWNLPKMVSKSYAPMFNSKARYIAYKGSRGSGKSEGVATKVILDIVTKPYVNWLVLRRYANTNRQSTFTLLQKVANRMGVGSLFQFNSSLPEITYKPTGQKILFRGADKPLSITSISVETGNLCRLWVEEAYQLELEDAFDPVDESMRGIIEDPDGYYQTINWETYAAIEFGERVTSQEDFNKSYGAYMWLTRKLADEAGANYDLDDNDVIEIKTHNFASRTGRGSDHVVDPIAFLAK